jgi:hypothetical protein
MTIQGVCHCSLLLQGLSPLPGLSWGGLPSPDPAEGGILPLLWLGLSWLQRKGRGPGRAVKADPSALDLLSLREGSPLTKSFLSSLRCETKLHRMLYFINSLYQKRDIRGNYCHFGSGGHRTKELFPGVFEVDPVCNLGDL